MKLRLPHTSTLWAILAGISYVLCFPKWDLPLFSLLFLPCLILSVHQLRSWRQAIALGFLISAMIAWGGFPWIIYVSQNFGNMPLAPAIFILCLYCLVAGPQLLGFFAIGYKLRFAVERFPLAIRPLFWSALYVSLEYLARFVKIFPEHLGNTLIAFPSLAQAASLGGVSLLGFFPLWIGGSLIYMRKHGSKALPSFAASILLAASFWVWGAQHITHVESQPTKTYRVGLIQHNTPEVEKLALHSSTREAIDAVINHLLQRTKELVEKHPELDLLIWPETAYPISFPMRPTDAVGSYAHGYANIIKNFVAAYHVPLLFGGYERDNGLDYNAAMLLDDRGQPAASYRKQVLLIFVRNKRDH